MTPKDTFVYCSSDSITGASFLTSFLDERAGNWPVDWRATNRKDNSCCFLLNSLQYAGLLPACLVLQLERQARSTHKASTTIKETYNGCVGQRMCFSIYSISPYL